MDISSFLELIANSESKHDLLHEIKPKILGKDSKISQILSNLKDMSLEEKKEIGQSVGKAKNDLETAVQSKLKELEILEINKKLACVQYDATIPVELNEGKIHQITKVGYECVKILERYGFSYYDGPEIEEDWFNFEALNVGKDHPARQMQDTFYLQGKNSKNENYLLRTHTTSVDIRTILESDIKLPFAITSFGKTFRVDSDATHSPMFHQIELLMVDNGLNMGHLKYIIERFLGDFFETDDINIRFRPSFFPFTEPSAEVDLGYYVKNDKIIIGGNDKFLEIGGCGMIHPNVLQNCNIDSAKYCGIAFGLGIDRLAMLKNGIIDVRDFTRSNKDWLNHYGFLHVEL